MTRSSRIAALAISSFLTLTGLAVSAPAHADDPASGITFTGGQYSCECGGLSPYVLTGSTFFLGFSDESPAVDAADYVITFAPTAGGTPSTVSAEAVPDQDDDFSIRLEADSSDAKDFPDYDFDFGTSYTFTVDQLDGTDVVDSGTFEFTPTYVQGPTQVEVDSTPQAPEGEVYAGVANTVAYNAAWPTGLTYSNRIAVSNALMYDPAVDSIEEDFLNVSGQDAALSTFTLPTSLIGDYVWISTEGHSDTSAPWQSIFEPLKVVAAPHNGGGSVSTPPNDPVGTTTGDTTGGGTAGGDTGTGTTTTTPPTTGTTPAPKPAPTQQQQKVATAKTKVAHKSAQLSHAKAALKEAKAAGNPKAIAHAKKNLANATKALAKAKNALKKAKNRAKK